MPHADNSPPRQLSHRRAVLYLLTVLAVIPGQLRADGGPALYAASVTYAKGTVALAGREATLDIVVRNAAAYEGDDWITAVFVDFSRTGIVPLDPGPLPEDWQARIEQGTVITYHAGHGVSAVHGGEVVRLAPRVRNPSAPKLITLPRIIIVPLASMADFQGPALRAIERVPHVEVRPTGRLPLKR